MIDIVAFIFPLDPAAWGALLTGVASVLAVLFTLRKSKAKSEDNCNERIEQMVNAFKAGTMYELREAQRKARDK